jgi:hypothetical protein
LFQLFPQFAKFLLRLFHPVDGLFDCPEVVCGNKNNLFVVRQVIRFVLPVHCFGLLPLNLYPHGLLQDFTSGAVGAPYCVCRRISAICAARFPASFLSGRVSFAARPFRTRCALSVFIWGFL